MTPMVFDLGSGEIVIVVLIALVLFGGSRIAGLGKGAGRAIREFKEETSNIAAAAASEQAAMKPAEAVAEPQDNGTPD